MSQWKDFSFARYTDGILAIELQPPTPIGGWDIRFQMTKRFGSTDFLINKSANSGYGANESGIAIINSGQGQFHIAINSVETSGLDYGVYAHAITRYSSGFHTQLVEGYIVLTPSAG